MIVRIKKANHEIIIIHKFPIIHDARLSLKAKGLLTYLCGHSDSWEARVDDIAAHCKDGRESVITGLKELQEHGYAVKALIRNDKGQIVDTHWTISELPPDVSQPEQPESEKPITDKPESGKPIPAILDETPSNQASSPKSDLPETVNPTLRSKDIRKRSLFLLDQSGEKIETSPHPATPDPDKPDYAAYLPKNKIKKPIIFHNVQPSDTETLRRQELLRQAQQLKGA